MKRFLFSIVAVLAASFMYVSVASASVTPFHGNSYCVGGQTVVGANFFQDGLLYVASTPWLVTHGYNKVSTDVVYGPTKPYGLADYDADDVFVFRGACAVPPRVIPIANEDVCTDVNYTRADGVNGAPGSKGQFFQLPVPQYVAWLAGTPYVDAAGVTVKAMQPANYLQGIGTSCDRTDGFVATGLLTDQHGTEFVPAGTPWATLGWYPYFTKIVK